MTTNYSEDVPQKWDIPAASFAMGAQICMFLLIATVNVLTLVVMAVTPKLQTIHNLYIVALAGSDLLVSFNQVLAIPWTSPKYHHHFETNSSLCLFFKCLVFINELASIFIIVLIALDRLLYIRQPFWYIRVVTKTKVKIAIAVVWILSFGIAIPIRLTPSNTRYTGCDAYALLYDSEKAGYVHGVLYFFICSATFISYGIVIRTAVRQVRIIAIQRKSIQAVCQSDSSSLPMPEDHHGKLDVSLNLKLVQKMAGVFVLLFVCWTPYVLIGLIGPKRVNQQVILMTGFLAAFNSAANYAVYALADREFRTATAEMLRCRKKLAVQEPTKTSSAGGSVKIEA